MINESKMNIDPQIYDNFEIDSEIIFSGNDCGVATYSNTPTGMVHFLIDGVLLLESQYQKSMVIEEPSIIFFPKPHSHRYETVSANGVNLLCAKVKYSVGFSHPIVSSFPNVCILPLKDIPLAKKAIELFLEESLDNNADKHIITQKISSIILVYLTRSLIEKNMMQLGILNALVDKQISKSLACIHQRFNENITIAKVANEVGLSRTVLSSQFKKVIGMTFYDYLSHHRLKVAKELLLKRKSVKTSSLEVGFSSPSSFIRKFKKAFGMTPSDWQKRNNHSTFD